MNTEVPREFEARVMKALGNGETEIEASVDIIKSIYPPFKAEDLLIHYKGLTVFTQGGREKYIQRERVPVEHRSLQWKQQQQS